MQKTILITGSTDGIGLETARMLLAQGHHVLLHGRNSAKLDATKQSLLAEVGPDCHLGSYVADLSSIECVDALADAVQADHQALDVLINNAGVFRAPNAMTDDGLDIRFAVNTIAPYRLTQRLLPLLGPNSRVINLSSAAQSPVDLDALAGNTKLAEDFAAYAQSKLGITMWSRALAKDLGMPVIIAVNPGSMLGSKMVKDNFGVPGHDIGIGAKILTDLALNAGFEAHSGDYYDNDIGQFSSPHPDGLDEAKNNVLVQAIEQVLTQHVS
ncbi:SDR family NAD(P)-dependent oxidoreductase [Neptuniibacter pectenicola]|jgi:NAD(P)-dependent dehydrogenase (short-subunit alcohol dehydrogenase family)|uniref:SDR family NAD(P)-dependent oxidoreductase n=1 Tax=Neptuniibacter pectenicola TaxID=1806669 RepID=UPI00082A7A52|nr:SDR family NAD(P)-dependent oxidoreductase [Neptuniibacter pectenicola]|tara:strand:- start:1674 stop:2483 length:810 start_codon:yes stop_codon:yes gene_type:complete